MSDITSVEMKRSHLLMRIENSNLSPSYKPIQRYPFQQLREKEVISIGTDPTSDFILPEESVKLGISGEHLKFEVGKGTGSLVNMGEYGAVVDSIDPIEGKIFRKRLARNELLKMNLYAGCILKARIPDPEMFGEWAYELEVRPVWV